MSVNVVLKNTMPQKKQKTDENQISYVEKWCYQSALIWTE